MGRAPCCSKVGLQRGPWTAKEDTLLTKYIQKHGEGNWRSLPKKAGLLRCGKSCRLRWMNYLRPDIKRGNITLDEDDLIIKLHALLGNRWSLIAGRLPGRTDNEIKNYWNTHLSKRLKTQGFDPNTHRKLSKLPQEPKKRNNKNKNKNKDKSTPILEQEKLKVYNPKAIRVSSLSSFSFSRNNSFGGDDKMGSGTEGVELVQWSHLKDGGEIGFLIGDDQDKGHGHDLMNGYDDLECHSRLPTCGNTLEKLYEEYQQLLMKEGDDQVLLDHSFADSLLI